MLEVMRSYEFWVGLVVLLSYQCAQFVELGTPRSPTNETHGIPDLRASDFIGPWTFASGLVTYLIVTTVLYALACSAAPQIVGALLLIFESEMDAGSEASLAKALEDSETLPIYIAALYMGLVQPQIPVLRRISAVQRNIFHSFIGIPGRVIEASKDFNLAVASEDTSEDDLRAMLRKLTSAAWRRTINKYADIGFYERQLARLGLMEEGRETALRGSKREMLRDVQALVFAASLATTREGGGRALPLLAGDLGVPTPKYVSRMRVALACIVVLLISTVGLWAFLELVAYTMTPTELGWYMWPERPEDIRDALFDQVVPLLVSIGLAVWMLPSPWPTEPPPAGDVDWSTLLVRAAPAITVVFVFVMLYDYARLFLQVGEQGILDRLSATQVREYYFRFLPVHMLHALVCVLACTIVLARGGSPTSGSGTVTSWRIVARMTVVVGMAAAVYAIVRLRLEFNIPVELASGVEFGEVGCVALDGTNCFTLARTLDLVPSMVGLNVVAAIGGLGAATLFYKHVRTRLQVGTASATEPRAATGLDSSAPERA